MKLQDYKHPTTGEIREVDLHEMNIQGAIPATLEIDGEIWERVWGQASVIMPLHMTAEYNRIHRFRGRGPSSSPTGKRTLFGGGRIGEKPIPTVS